MEQWGKGRISGTEEPLKAIGFWLKNQGEDWEDRLGECYSVRGGKCMHLCEINDKLLILTVHSSLRKEDCQ